MTPQPAEGGGSAFPSHGTMGEVVQTGLTKREYYAAKAMQGICAHPSAAFPIAKPEDVAGWCFLLADAMIAAGNRG